jgi:prepilin-type N-terminal cleavage/methylation domain-containing protein/prepilin-type processing-associated H-X9-DG protein
MKRCSQKQSWAASSTRGLSLADGFTLIELLVVIAIIALLASLLLPTLTASQQRARSIGCTSNLHQLGIALRLYLDDDKVFPLATSGDGLGNWQRALRPAAGEKTLYCPQRKKASDEFLQIFPSSDTQIMPHYGYNFIGATHRNPPPLNPGLGGDFIWDGSTGHFAPAPENRIRVPSAMIAIGDSAAFVRPGLAPPPSVTPKDPLYVSFPFVVPAWGYAGVGDWHEGKANMLFCDGHTESAKQSLWLDASDERKRLWNNDNLPHEECW